MRCDRFREAASARLDGEPIGMSLPVLEHHLTSCLDCARWVQEATWLTRHARVGTAAMPDLTETITADVLLPARRVLRRRWLVRAALALVGFVQLAIAVPSLTGGSLGMAMSTHAAHESAAWNIALAVAFLAAALRPRRATGMIPLLAAFVVVLGALCVHDLAAGVVSADRVSTHLVALAGLLLVVALDRAERALPPGGSAAADSRQASGSERGSGSDDGPGGLRGVA